jgi:hypothetical protein
VQLATTQELTRYWAAEYDWRRCEAKLNTLPQFTTHIDGPGSDDLFERTVIAGSG